MTKTKIILITIALLILITVISLTTFRAKDSADFVVRLLDNEENIKIEKTIDYNEGDLLIDLIEDNFNNVLIEDGFIYNIEDFKTPEDFSEFLSIVVNGELSNVGLKEIKFNDDSVIDFVITSFDGSYEN